MSENSEMLGLGMSKELILWYQVDAKTRIVGLVVVVDSSSPVGTYSLPTFCEY